MHILAFAVLVVAADPAAAPSAFDSAKKGAFALEHPANAIAVLVGACDAGGGAVNGECLENTKELKDKVTAKRVFIDLGKGYETLLSWGGRPTGKPRFVWGPLFDPSNGLALTVGKPQKISDAGNVVVAKRPIDGTSPDELTDLDMQRLATTGMLGIQIVGKFGKTWSLTGGGKSVKGVQFEVEALRLYNARTGATVFESTQSLK